MRPSQVRDSRKNLGGERNPNQTKDKKNNSKSCLDHLLSSRGWGVEHLWNLLFVFQAKALRGLASVCFVSVLKCYFKKDLGEHSFGALFANSVIWQLENNEFHTNLAVGRNETKVTGMLLYAGFLLSLALCSWSARESQRRAFPRTGSRTHHQMAEEPFSFSVCVSCCVFLCVHTCVQCPPQSLSILLCETRS